MKRVWFAVFVLLVLGILAGIFTQSSSPTSAFSVNLPPVWDYAADDFLVNDIFTLNLNNAFFDPDLDDLAFGILTSEGVNAGISNNELIVKLNADVGSVLISASDGTSTTIHNLVFRKKI